MALQLTGFSRLLLLKWGKYWKSWSHIKPLHHMIMLCSLKEVAWRINLVAWFVCSTSFNNFSLYSVYKTINLLHMRKLQHDKRPHLRLDMFYYITNNSHTLYWCAVNRAAGPHNDIGVMAILFSGCLRNAKLPFTHVMWNAWCIYKRSMEGCQPKYILKL